MKKKLVFHFYCGEDWENNISVKLHFACLSRFCHIFDEILIVIALDDENCETDFLLNFKNKLNSVIRHPFVTFKVAKNTPYRESTTFFNEVVNTDYDGLVFFAHNKGYTNVYNTLFKKQYVLEWIFGMYWFCLSFMDEVEYELIGNNGFFYGAFELLRRDNEFCVKSLYPGTFFWINPTALKVQFMHQKLKMPNLGGRYSAEEFPGLVCNMLDSDYSRGHGMWRWYNDSIDFYGMEEEESIGAKEAIKMVFTDDFETFEKEMSKTIQAIENN